MRNRLNRKPPTPTREKSKWNFWPCLGMALLLFIFLSPSQLNAQNLRAINGKVLDSATGKGIGGVSVVVKGTSRGASTGIDGSFTVQAQTGDVLAVSFISYEDANVAVTSQNAINILLKESSSILDEAVVVGYGTQRKATLTGSVTSISNKQLKRSPVTNLSNALAGQLPGVIASNRTGEPGKDNSTILIRGRSTTGDNSPLVVVDGIQGVVGWERINPNDIESISVLKDASAAIYGAQAANGVILITTKRGKTGKPTISYTMNQGINTPTRVPKMASSAIMGEYVNELLAKDNQPPRWTAEELQKFADGSDPVNYPSVNWYDEILSASSLQSQHNLSLRGGSESIKYSVSGSFSNQEGIFKKGSTNFKSYSIRSNVDAQVNKNIKVGFDVNAGIDDGNYPNSSTTNTFSRMLVVPWVPVYWPNGSPSAGIEKGDNPAVMVTDATGNINDFAQRYQMKASFDINLPFVQGLGVDGYFAYTNNNTINKNFQRPWTVYNYDATTEVYTPVGGGGILNPQLKQSSFRNRTSLINLRLKYERHFDDHHVNAFVAVEQEQVRIDTFSAFRRNFISGTIDQLLGGSLAGQEANGLAVERGRKNFFGRFGYGFRDKYLIDFNFRYDGSSIFPKGKQFGFFPGVAAAWRIMEEGFMNKDKIGFIDDLKLRVSYGKIGNDRVAAFQFLQNYTLGGQGYNFGASPTQSLGLVAGVYPNPNITWEVLKTANIGLDGLFLNGLLGFSLDFFRQERSNILATRDLAVPSFTGLNLPSENIGVVQNKGVELEVSHKKTIRKFSYRVAANVAYVRNKVIDISEASNVPDWQKAEGRSIGVVRDGAPVLYYNALGIIRTKEELDAIPKVLGTKVGDLKYEDVNGDGMITFLDQKRYDRTNTPQMTFGLNISMDYENFSLFANFAGQARAWQYFHENARLAINSREELLVNRYREGSMDSKYPILPLLDTRTDVSGLSSTFWLRDASFVRLKTIELSYTIPRNILTALKVQDLRVYVNANNLFTIDKLKIYDPEGSDERGTFYPQSKIYNLGVNLTF